MNATRLVVASVVLAALGTALGLYALLATPGIVALVLFAGRRRP